MAAEIQQPSIYGIDLSRFTDEERIRFLNRPKTTYFEIEIPKELEDEISNAVEEIIRKHKSK